MPFLARSKYIFEFFRSSLPRTILRNARGWSCYQIIIWYINGKKPSIPEEYEPPEYEQQWSSGNCSPTGLVFKGFEKTLAKIVTPAVQKRVDMIKLSQRHTSWNLDPVGQIKVEQYSLLARRFNTFGLGSKHRTKSMPCSSRRSGMALPKRHLGEPSLHQS